MLWELAEGRAVLGAGGGPRPWPGAGAGHHGSPGGRGVGGPPWGRALRRGMAAIRTATRWSSLMCVDVGFLTRSCRGCIVAALTGCGWGRRSTHVHARGGGRGPWP